MASNLPSTQKEDWSLNDTVLPEHTNSWGSAINKLTKAIPIYASNGNYYKVQSFSNNIITLSPIADEDDSTNETVDSYVDGMQVIFQSTFDTTEDCSVNINNLGAKQIKTVKNKPISKGDITLGNFVQLIYSKNADVFYLVGPSQNGGGLEICDIGMALYVDETKGLRRYLNGQIVDINTNTKAFLNRLKQITTLHPSLLCTEEEWQTAKTMSAFGQVGKFVFNYNGDDIVSVRLPRVVNVQGLFDLQNLGMTVGAGLPTHTHTRGTMEISGSFPAGRDGWGTSGAFSQTSSATTYSGGKYRMGMFDFYASRSWTGSTSAPDNSVYGASNTVQQEAIQYPYFIQIATGSETEANIVNTLENVNGFTLLESKYSDKPLYNESWLLSNGQWNAKAVYPTAYEGLQVEYNTEIEAGTTVTLPSGVSYTKRGLSVKLSTEEYTDYDFVLNTADETFRLPLKTKLASGKAVVGNGMTLGLTNGSANVGLFGIITTGNVSIFESAESAYGEPVGSTKTTVGRTNINTMGITTDPIKSGIELSDSGLYLYFYVGETVQNANLIDAGRIGEQLANKIGRTECKSYITETYQNGTSGYRLYSDKYIEQWGSTVANSSDIKVTLIKEMANTDYFILHNINTDSSNTMQFRNVTSGTKTTTQFKINNAVVSSIWKVTGYAK